ncbi:nitroreductase family protein [bacterium]|nr:MAG: nitroreductase family protein [bacterium]
MDENEYIFMKFKRYNYKKKNDQEMFEHSHNFMQLMLSRRSIRDFSSKAIPDIVIKNILKTAISSPSGANKQPWSFVVVNSKGLKKKIRIAAEQEEKKFYEKRATDEWLKDLNKFETNWEKPFLEEAPALIIVFRQSYDNSGSKKRKNYYVNESVGIASGFLLAAIQNAGLVCLTHTPSPMGFLEKILERPKNEKAYLLIPIGFPKKDAQVPVLDKKPYNESVKVL